VRQKFDGSISARLGMRPLLLICSQCRWNCWINSDVISESARSNRLSIANGFTVSVIVVR
jgi:hypothetical protein